MKEKQGLPAPKAQINFKINTDLKDAAYLVLKDLGVTPTDFITQLLQYVVENKRLPFKKVILSIEDEALLKAAKAGTLSSK